MWRFVQGKDLETFSKNVAREEVKLGISSADGGKRVYDRYIGLVSKLSAGNLPEDFLIIVYRGPANCGCGSLEHGSI
jgi:hypothetical protein